MSTALQTVSEILRRKRAKRNKAAHLDLIDTLISEIVDHLANLVRRFGETSNTRDEGAVAGSDLNSNESQGRAEYQNEQKPFARTS